MRIAPNTYAEVDYVLEDADGEILDDSTAEDGEPLRYVHGYGMLVPGLEKRLEGLDEGNKADIVVPADEAYGLHDDELVFAVDREQAPNAREGDEIVLEEGDEAPPVHTPLVAHVVEVRPEELVVDGNHPLAGLTLHYRVTVRSVREATETEIEEAARAFDEEREQAEPREPGEDPSFVPLFALRRPKDDRPN